MRTLDLVSIHRDAQGYIPESRLDGSKHIHAPGKARTDTNAIEQLMVLLSPDLDGLDLLALLD
jgi:hypothetical protein